MCTDSHKHAHMPEHTLGHPHTTHTSHTNASATHYTCHTQHKTHPEEHLHMCRTHTPLKHKPWCNITHKPHTTCTHLSHTHTKNVPPASTLSTPHKPQKDLPFVAHVSFSHTLLQTQKRQTLSLSSLIFMTRCHLIICNWLEQSFSSRLKSGSHFES